MSAPAPFSPFAMGNTQARAQPRRYPAGARSHVARITRTHNAGDAQPTQSEQPRDPVTSFIASNFNIDSSSTAPAADGEHEPVFGPTHPLHPLVSAHLPDVLTRVVLAYLSPLLPRSQHYRGHVLLKYGAYGFRDQREQYMSANPLSLQRRSFSWSGWMNRVPSVAARSRNHFLLSFECQHRSNDAPGYWLHIGYRKHYNAQHNVSQNQCFTFAFFSNDLDARPADTALDTFGTWEHWSGSFEYPRTQTTPPIHNDSTFTSDSARQYPAGTVLGRRRLYRNGRLVVEDDCLPLMADEESRLVVGNYQHHGHDMTLDGGVCDVRLYSRVLSEAEMRALY